MRHVVPPLVSIEMLCLVGALSGFAAERPNIVFFMTDDILYDFFGYSGHPVVQTPSIDRFAENGTVFEKSYVTSATCWISRASIFSGKMESCI